MSFRWGSRAALVGGLLLLGGCFDPAVSAQERIARGCADYAESLQAAAKRNSKEALFHLRDAEHWAELAGEKDKAFESIEAAFGHLIADLDHDDDVVPEPAVLADARRQALAACEQHAEPDVVRSITLASS